MAWKGGHRGLVADFRNGLIIGGCHSCECRSPVLRRIAQEVARRFGVKPGELLQRYARSQARQALAELSCRRGAARAGMRGIAKILGVSVAALHLSRRRFRKRLMEERVLRRRLAEVEATLRE